MARGFAVYDNGKCLVWSVSEYERAAKVNWLWRAARENVTNAWPDEKIHRKFTELTKGRGIVISEVEIRPLGGQYGGER